MRPDGRASDQLRPTTIELGPRDLEAGSVPVARRARAVLVVHGVGFEGGRPETYRAYGTVRAHRWSSERATTELHARSWPWLAFAAKPPSDAPPGAVVITARGPFTTADDLALMRSHAIDTLVTKNSGGAAVASKLEAARAYPEIASDVDRILNQEGVHAIQTERRHLARNGSPGDGAAETPYYELHGEKQVAAGHYEHVLRYREHVIPLVEALRYYSEKAYG